MTLAMMSSMICCCSAVKLEITAGLMSQLLVTCKRKGIPVNPRWSQVKHNLCLCSAVNDR